jgi:hypothetical protein
MTRSGRFVRRLVALGVVALMAASCSRVSVDGARAALAADTGLPVPPDALRVLSVQDGDRPIARVQFGPVAAEIRFRRDGGRLVVDAVRPEGGEWQGRVAAFEALRSRATGIARRQWLAREADAYARTFELLEGWTEVLRYTNLARVPQTLREFLGYHEVLHRSLFGGRGIGFHNTDLFSRDAWRRPIDATPLGNRFLARSRGADGALRTDDDILLEWTRTPVPHGVTFSACYTMPGVVVEELGRPDAPPVVRNHAARLAALEAAHQLHRAGYAVPLVPAVQPARDGR